MPSLTPSESPSQSQMPSASPSETPIVVTLVDGTAGATFSFTASLTIIGSQVTGTFTRTNTGTPVAADGTFVFDSTTTATVCFPTSTSTDVITIYGDAIQNGGATVPILLTFSELGNSFRYLYGNLSVSNGIAQQCDATFSTPGSGIVTISP